ncbi:MAG: sigma-70 family RNA polymerase sigma factor [Candidatus Cloacimonetes bacterium]|nr:sigma-70 family RNA polymerase sigma factor [Candidatus Cloacimonadota bacterium]MBT4575708.1 sigma-70 family RNA polymerase sigma factor [Candidatus Cloacimonadota bacterium]
MKWTDQDLIAAYRSGDMDAFQIFYGKYKDSLYTFLYNRCKDDASDIFQETFMKFIDSASKKELTNPKAYLFQIAMNLVRNLSRKAKVLSLSDEFDIPDIETEEIEQVSEDTFKESLSYLAQEKPLLHDVLHLHIFSKMTFEEIGKLKEISRDTIASRYRYALNYLRKFLQNDQLQIKEG